MYQKLVNIIEQKSQVELEFKKKKTEFENANSVLIAQLEDLKEKEILLREEAILALEKDEKTSVEVGDKVIYSQVRITKSIGDPSDLMIAMENKKEEMNKSGINMDIPSLFTTSIELTNKKLALGYAKQYNDLTGKEFEGIKVKITNFITIKNK